MTDDMKAKPMLMTLVAAVLSSMSLYAQDLRYNPSYDTERYEGQWPKGEGVLYSYEKGLVIGTFDEGRPEGRCVCYKPNGEVYWGDFRKGKATGHGRIYRDNGIVIVGEYRNGRYHGTDTLYRKNGTVHVGKYRKGKLKSKILDTSGMPASVGRKPDYPKVDLKRKHEDFLKDLELLWEERNLRIRQNVGFVNPRFQGGSVDDFALWVNSRVDYPTRERNSAEGRTVIVEFFVMEDGSVAEVHAIFGSDAALNEAAVNAVKKSPKWEPGEQNGQKKRVKMTVPVVFSLD